MKQLIFLLLFTSAIFAQSELPLLFDDESWSEQMLKSYIEINDHYTFSPEQKALIKERLEDEYIVSRFGKDGLNKTVCDFFLFFQDSSTDALDGRTITKSDSTLRWDYGGGNIYWQNNLPAQIPDGVITVTSADGFGGVTVFDLYYEDFNYATFDVAYYMPNITTLNLGGNGFDGVIPPLPSTLITLNLIENDFTGTLPDLSELTNIITIEVYNNYNLTGSISNNIKAGSQTFNYSNTQLSTIDATTFSRSLKTFYIYNCEVADIDTLVRRMSAYYQGLGANLPLYDCTIDLRGALNGYLTGGLTNQYYITLDSVWTAAGKTLTFLYNTDYEDFDKGKIVFTFDDPSSEGVYDLVLPLFAEKGITGTVYTTVETIGGQTTSYPTGILGCTWAELGELEDSGWVIGSHSYEHQPLGSMTIAEATEQLDSVVWAFNQNGFTQPKHFAYPNGSYIDSIANVVESRFLTARLVAPLFSEPVSYMVGYKSDYYLIPSYWFDGLYSPTHNTDMGADISHLAEFTKRIDFAETNKTALIFALHHIDTTAAAYTTTIDLLEAVIDYAQTKNVDIVNIDKLYRQMEALESKRYFASLPVALADSQEINIDNLVRMLKDTLAIDSLSQKFSGLWIYANETVVSALNNLVKRDHDCDTVAGSPIFTQWIGWEGDANDALTTDFIPSSDGGDVFTQNSASLGTYIHTTGASGQCQLGGNDALRWAAFSPAIGGVSYLRINNAVTASGIADTIITGLHIGTRTASTTINAYSNSILQGSESRTSTGLPTIALWTLARNNNGTISDASNGRKLSIAFVGAGFTATQVRGITNCFEAYMDEIGQGKIP